MASFTGQFVEGIEVDVCSVSDDELDTCLEGCKGVLVCATGRDAFFPSGESDGEPLPFIPSCALCLCICLLSVFPSVSLEMPSSM